jgi:multidrug efflux pump subunit AcrB
MEGYFEELELESGGRLRIEARGRQLETTKSLAGIQLGFVVASVLIYVILAWLFGSYFQPVAVMLGIPFSMIGVIWGHYITGFEIMILSLIGFVALTGIVVNDSLILIELYNHKRAEGMDVRSAMLETSKRRLRPIVLTTATTVLGLLPLMLETSFQARLLIPMAVAISFGLMSATILILIVLPCIILIGEDIKTVTRFLWVGPVAASVD